MRPRRPPEGRRPATVPSSTVQSPPKTSGRRPASAASRTLAAVLGDGGGVLGAAVALVRPPATHPHRVPVVLHLRARAGEPSGQIGVPEGLRAFLLAGRERPHARRHPDQAHRLRHDRPSSSRVPPPARPKGVRHYVSNLADAPPTWRLLSVTERKHFEYPWRPIFYPL